MSSAHTKNHSNRKLVARVGDLTHGQSKKFVLRRGGRDFEALLIKCQEEIFAYVNRCPHIGLTLDWVDNQFFTVDSRYLMCANHGAVFEPATGECVWGPCVGASLEKLVLNIEGEKIFVLHPDDNEETGSYNGRKP
jgi:nitrite reductase/ring-hydroxylating ferredoxin subunit